MSKEMKIDTGTTINLSYNFLYEEESVFDGVKDGSIKDSDLKYENLLNYVDRLYKKNKIFHYDNVDGKKLYLYDKKKFKSYELIIKDIYILFFENNMAFLNLKLKYMGEDLEELYKINKSLTNFYTKIDQTFVAVGDKNHNIINMSSEEYENGIKKYENIPPETNEEKPLLKTFKIDKNSKIYSAFIKTYSPVVKKDYPFANEDASDELKSFQDRVGPTKVDKNIIHLQNEEDYEGEVNEHYLYFQNQQKLNKKIKKEEKQLRYIDYDTFITSLIIKYVKPNNGVLFYDNFNPIATNYINSYITISCDSSMIKEAVNDNFLSFEPLISSKPLKGKCITNPDYFNIFQSQSDMFTIGNSHNIVHILDNCIEKNTLKSIKDRKASAHFYTYQLSQLQRSSILRIINASILNVNDIVQERTLYRKIIDSYKTYRMINKSVEDYAKYLTNINFSIISNSSSMDNSYQFFRKCNEVGMLNDQWGKVSLKLKDSKTIIGFILNENMPLLIIFTLGGILLTFHNEIMQMLNELIK